MKSLTFFAEITKQKAEMYLSERGKLEPLSCLPARLVSNKKFLCEFNENCFAIFNQSSHVIYLMCCRSLLFFPEFTSIIPFIV